MSRTIDQKTNLVGFPKAGEMIEITGDHDLDAGDRAALNVLYQHAHDSGRLTDPDAEFVIELARLRASLHESNDRVRDSLIRLLRVVVTIPVCNAETDEAEFLLTHLFDFFQIPAREGDTGATVRYGIPRKLQPVLARSRYWARIKSEIVCAMTSKYAQKLYELIQLRANLQKCVETIPIDRFREMMAVPPGKLTRGPDFMRRVIEPALLEVNGLSDYGVSIDLIRKRSGGPITAVTLAWWKKEGDQYREVLRERARPKLGRMARLKDTLAAVVPGAEDNLA